MGRLLVVAVVLAALAPGQESRRAAFRTGGWDSLWNGESLDPWFVTRGGRYDGNATWTVEAAGSGEFGVICGRQGPDHAGGLLYTASRYACFILSVDVWMTRPNDSGIFVRMTPEARGLQVTLDDRDDGEIGAIYSDGFLAHNTTARNAWTPSAWNRVEVRCTGREPRVEAWLNGAKISDHQVAPGTPGFATTGLIGFQVHGGRDDPPGTVVKFRNDAIQELPVFDTADFTADDAGVMTPTEAGAKRGWRLLSDGRAWPEGVWRDDGFFAEPRGGGGTLATVDDFENFEMHLDFRLQEEGANSGVFLRAARDDSNPAFSGCEIQILDDHGWEKAHPGAKLEAWQKAGSVYGSSPPKDTTALHRRDRWNSYRVVFEGSRLRVDLNGLPVQDVDVLTLPFPKSTRPFAERHKKGFIGLQRHDASPHAVAFRNMFVRPLP